jgi:hypothetical protein
VQRPALSITAAIAATPLGFGLRYQGIDFLVNLHVFTLKARAHARQAETTYVVEGLMVRRVALWDMGLLPVHTMWRR